MWIQLWFVNGSARYGHSKTQSSSRSMPISSGRPAVRCNEVERRLGRTRPPTHGRTSKTLRRRTMRSAGSARRQARVARRSPIRGELQPELFRVADRREGSGQRPKHLALDGGPRDQAVRERRGHQRDGVERAGREAEQRHVAGVAAEGADVLVNPLQRGELVEDAVLAGGQAVFCGQGGMPDEAERAEPVVERHDHDAARGRMRTRPPRLGRSCCRRRGGAPSRAGRRPRSHRRGAKTLRKRQSSLPSVSVTLPSSSKANGWRHGEPNAVASRTPVHEAAGAGGRQRRAPTGGAAYGIPRHSLPSPSRLLRARRSA